MASARDAQTSQQAASGAPARPPSTTFGASKYAPTANALLLRTRPGNVADEALSCSQAIIIFQVNQQRAPLIRKHPPTYCLLRTTLACEASFNILSDGACSPGACPPAIASSASPQSARSSPTRRVRCVLSRCPAARHSPLPSPEFNQSTGFFICQNCDWCNRLPALHELFVQKACQ